MQKCSLVFCHVDASSCPQLSIQIRILRAVQDNEATRQEDADRLIDTLIRTGAIPPDYVSPAPPYSANGGVGDNALQLSGVEKKKGAHLDVPPAPSFPSNPSGNASSSTPVQFPSPSILPPTEVLPHLCTLHHMQNSRDAVQDLADLRNLMRAVMQTGSGAEFSNVLQVGKEGMPEALKILQRTLEQMVENEGAEGGPEEGKNKNEKGVKTASADTVDSGSWDGSRNNGRSKDTLDLEFIESGIDALRKMSGSVDAASLPSWTITR